MMHGILQRKVEQVGVDEQERLMLSFDKMFPRESGTALGVLFSYWQSKCSANGSLPSEEEFSSLNFLPNKTKFSTAWIDARTSDPFNFIVRNHPSMSDWGDQSNLRLGELASKMNAKSCAMDYLNCISLRQPMYHEIEQTVGSNSRHYVRLLLPVVNPSNYVTKLIYAVRMFSATGLRSPSTNS
jgi:hypothetical protein